MTDLLIEGLGEKENIEEIRSNKSHLSVVVKNVSEVNLARLQSLTEVSKIEFTGQTLSFLLTRDAEAVVKDMQKVLSGDKPASKRVEKKRIGTVIIDAITGIFSPILAGLAGAGILQGITILLTEFGIITESSVEHAILSSISDAVFYFMPLLLAFSSAKVFKANPYLSVIIAGFLLHPTMIELMSNYDQLAFFGLTVPSARYANSVIPIILIVGAQSYLEKIINRFIPKTLNMILSPVLVLLIGSILGIVLLGPIGTFIGDAMAAFIGMLNDYVPWLVPIAMGALAPFIIMAGIHYSLFPVVTLSLSQLGYDNIMIPGMFASNLALSGVALAVALRTKKPEFKAYAYSSSLTASMGVSQPAIYGIGLLLKKPLYAGIIGGAVGGVYAGFVDLKAFAFANPGVAALPVFINEGNNLLQAVITMVLSFAVGFVMTWLLGFDDPEDRELEKGI